MPLTTPWNVRIVLSGECGGLQGVPGEVGSLGGAPHLSLTHSSTICVSRASTPLRRPRRKRGILICCAVKSKGRDCEEKPLVSLHAHFWVLFGQDQKGPRPQANPCPGLLGQTEIAIWPYKAKPTDSQQSIALQGKSWYTIGLYVPMQKTHRKGVSL